MGQFERLFSRILSVVTLIGGIALIVVWRQTQQVQAAQIGLTVEAARNSTLLLLIPGMLMVALGAINCVPESLYPKKGSSTDALLHKLLSIIILLGGVVLIVLWSSWRQIMQAQPNLSVQDIQRPTLLLLIPGILFIGLGVINVIPQHLRGIHHAPAPAPSSEEPPAAAE